VHERALQLEDRKPYRAHAKHLVLIGVSTHRDAVHKIEQELERQGAGQFWVGAGMARRTGLFS
jgi:hypothetical protein